MASTARWWLTTLLLSTAVACNAPSTGCAGFTQKPADAFTGQALDSAGAFRLSEHGFATLNTQSVALLDVIAPGGRLDTTLACAVTSAGVLGSFTVADQGSVGCTDETCGQGDGTCDDRDAPKTITIAVSGLTLGAASPDLLEGQLTARVDTGELIVSSTSRNSPLCLFSGGGPVKCSVDFDTSTVAPPTNVLTLQFKLALRNGLVAVEVSDLKGTKACGASGALPAPQCIAPDDIAIARVPGGCDVCSAANATAVKQLLIDQLAKSIKTQVTKALGSILCQPCGPSGGSCPASASCSVDPATDAGVCHENLGGACTPRFLGVAASADLGVLLKNYGVPSTAALDLTVGLGGSAGAVAATSSPTGLSVGLRGGVQELSVAPCVSSLAAPTWPNLPLPVFDAELSASESYDVAFGLSQQMLAEAMFRAQQSGALCFEIGTDTIVNLESAALSAFLPSLSVLTNGENRPLRLVLRPTRAPTVFIGRGTQLNEPLMRFGWPGLEIDVYALVERRYARLFTLALELDIPVGLEVASCTSVRPVIGSLENAAKNVTVKNAALLAESVDDIARLVPTLLRVAGPGLAANLPALQLPEIETGLPLKLKLLQTRGVGQVSGTAQYNHVGIYGALVGLDAGCP